MFPIDPDPEKSSRTRMFNLGAEKRRSYKGFFSGNAGTPYLLENKRSYKRFISGNAGTPAYLWLTGARRSTEAKTACHDCFWKLVFELARRLKRGENLAECDPGAAVRYRVLR